MKKKAIVVAAGCAALCAMLLVGCAAKDTDGPVVFTCNGEEYHRGYVDRNVEELEKAAFLESGASYRDSLDMVVVKTMLESNFASENIAECTSEELETCKAEAQKLWAEAVNSYADDARAQDATVSEEMATKKAEEFYERRGFSVEALTRQIAFYHRIDRLAEKLVSVSDEEIAAEYAARVEAYRARFGDNVAKCELYRDLYGEEVLYMPAGFRGITRILLASDNPLLYTDVEAAREAVLAEHRQTIDAIYARLAQGESFEALIAEYGQDPYIAGNPETGYPVHCDSITYETGIVEAVFGAGMDAIGAVSEPVVTSEGVSIGCYACDIPAGPVAMSPAMRELIRLTLLEDKLFALLQKQADEHVQFSTDAQAKREAAS